MRANLLTTFVLLLAIHCATAQEFEMAILDDTLTMEQLFSRWGDQMRENKQWRGRLPDSLKPVKALSFYARQLQGPCKEQEAALERIGQFVRSRTAFELLKSVIVQPEDFFRDPAGDLECLGSSWGVRTYALSAIVQHRDPALVPFIMSLQKDTDFLFRIEVAAALWRSDPVAGRPALEALSRDADKFVREKASGYLREMQENYRPCTGDTLQAYIRLDKDTVELGDSPDLVFGLHNCTGERLFLYMGPGSFIPYYGLTLSVTLQGRGKNKPWQPDMNASNGMVFFQSFFPNTTIERPFRLSDWADLNETGTYEVTITKTCHLSAERNIFRVTAQDRRQIDRTAVARFEVVARK